MSTIHQLESILTRLESCPLNLVRVELEMFQNTLEADVHFVTVLREIVRRHEKELGSRISHIVNNIESSAWADLSFANSAPLRAAVGYQVLECLIHEPEPIKCGKVVVQIGTFYSKYQGVRSESRPADAIRVFSQLLLHPLVSYLRGAMDLRHRILMLLSRYKQRCEWFPYELPLQDAVRSGFAEKQLKKDFLRYLFDNGIDFSVEAENPMGGGEVDVLPALPDQGHLPIEVKVFDGQARPASYVSSGLAQAAEYARKFNSPEACLVVYNVAENTILSLPGIPAGPNVMSVEIGGITIYEIAANLRINLRASAAKNLVLVQIQVPVARDQSRV